MSILKSVLVWIPAGFAAAGLHLLLLRLALIRVAQLSPKQARKRITRGLPMRLLVQSPILFLATQAGLVPCLVFVLSSLLGHWFVYSCTSTRSQSLTLSSKRG